MPCGLPNEVQYGPDTTKNAEIGIRTQFFDRRLTFNFNVFQIKWDGIQTDSATLNGIVGITVNGGKCNIPSRRVVVGDVIGLGAKAKDMALVIEAQSLPEREIPDYVAPDGTDKVTFTRVPKLDEVPYPVTMEPNLIVEFYSR